MTQKATKMILRLPMLGRDPSLLPRPVPSLALRHRWSGRWGASERDGGLQGVEFLGFNHQQRGLSIIFFWDTRLFLWCPDQANCLYKVGYSSLSSRHPLCLESLYIRLFCIKSAAKHRLNHQLRGLAIKMGFMDIQWEYHMDHDEDHTLWQFVT